MEKAILVSQANQKDLLPNMNREETTPVSYKLIEGFFFYWIRDFGKGLKPYNKKIQTLKYKLIEICKASEIVHGRIINNSSLFILIKNKFVLTDTLLFLTIDDP